MLCDVRYFFVMSYTNIIRTYIYTHIYIGIGYLPTLYLDITGLYTTKKKGKKYNEYRENESVCVCACVCINKGEKKYEYIVPAIPRIIYVCV